MTKYYSLEQIKSAVKITHEKYGGMTEEFDLLKLLQMPSADVVSVVRCGECKFWTKQTDSIQGRCALFGMYPTSTWFCGNARRREDAEIH